MERGWRSNRMIFSSEVRNASCEKRQALFLRYTERFEDPGQRVGRGREAEHTTIPGARPNQTCTVVLGRRFPESQ